ncbi:hypothetical protein BJY01DRAFT_154424 [Aspergillus pseudoustus]|uniref:PhoD-like phosphatase domain-containing protein n=1 Tax=Aspergillus pseudoustus TaxID=1810923 RepID=A0ABR4K8E3_9EURO
MSEGSLPVPINGAMVPRHSDSGLAPDPSDRRQPSQNTNTLQNHGIDVEVDSQFPASSQSRSVAQAASLGPSALPKDHVASEASMSAYHEDFENRTSVMRNHSARLDRSDTVRSSSGEQHDWAFNRSPLQKLEVALSGISKEEKRARALEAERKLKERMATPAAKSAGSATHEVHATSTTRPSPHRVNKSRDAPIASSRKEHRKESKVRENADDGKQEKFAPEHEPGPERVSASRTGVPTLNGPASYPLVESQEAGNKPPIKQVMKGGVVPRRAVSISYQPGEPRASPQASSQVPTRSSHALFTQAPISSSPGIAHSPRDAPSVEPSAQAANQPIITTTQKTPGSEAVPQQIRQNGHHVNTPAVVATNLTSNPDLQGSGESMVPSSTENVQRLQTKSKRNTVSFDVPPPTPPPLSEWKAAPIARLELSDFDFQTLDVDKSKAWWEGGGTKDRRQSRALPKNYQKPPAQKLASNNRFQPLIFLKAGPLLRYSGLRRVRIDGPNGPVNKETWRGSILIVTKDSISSYDSPPTIRLFSQPMELLPPPPAQINSEGVKLAPEYIDPTAGLMKLGRDGRPLYVKPVDHTEEELDLSFIENDDGIYEMTPSVVDHRTESLQQPVPANRIHSIDGETTGTYKEIPGARLYADPGRDVTFWKFNIEIELGEKQQRVAYRLNQGPALGFWVPAKGQSMNIMFHSGNGFSPGVDSNKFCGPDPLWRDVLNEHQTRPFHVMIGGGDQIFNDKVTAESLHFQEWLRIKDPSEKYGTPLNAEFKAELETSYLDNYSRWFSQGLFSLANSQIPMVNIWNDHEILEGFGSYPDEFMSSAVISGLGNIAFKYYLLFQHHSVAEETEVDEPSWILGAEPGPYITHRSRHLFMSLGDGITFLGLDCRTERMSDEILSEHTSDLIWDRCHREIVRGETKHLIVLLSIPVAYPRVAMVKNILNSRQSLGKAGLFGGLVNRHAGRIEIFDDHWTAKHHKSERKYLIEDLQDLAAEKSIRVTIVSGDVHLAAIGQFYSNPSLNMSKDKDYRYMPNIISSGIADMPTTEMISDTLNRRNQVHHMDTNTDEDMIPIFTHDVNSKARNNKRLLPRRNWCSIRAYEPGATPPATPDSEPPASPLEPRPNVLQRTLSLNRGDRPQGVGLLRRLSNRARPPTKDLNLARAPPARRMSMDGPFPPAATNDSYFPPPADFRPGPFLRRPTNLSQKAAKKAAKRGDDGAGTFVNLAGGLAVTLNLELNPKDPSGITTPYKLLIPALWFEGTEYDPPAVPITKGWRKWLPMRRNVSSKPSLNDDGAEDYDSDEDEHDEHQPTLTQSKSPPHPQQQDNRVIASAPAPLPRPRQPYYDDYDDDEESELFLEPEPQSRPNVKRSTSIKKWFGRS